MATLDVYSDPDPETTTADGYITHSVSTWAGVRGATSGTALSAALAEMQIKAQHVSTNYHIERAFALWDTSPLGAASTVSAASIFLKITAAYDSPVIHAVSSTPTSNTFFIGADYNDVGSTSFGSVAAANGFQEIVLNASGIANISKTGISKFGFRDANDLNNVTPTLDTTHAASFYSVDRVGVSDDPYLRITYTTSAGDFLSFLPL